jgi:hypothetical protein
MRAPLRFSVAETVHNLSAIAIAMAVAPQYVCGAADFICTRNRKSREPTSPDADLARGKRRKNTAKNPLLEGVCLLTTGGLIRVRRSVLVETPEPPLNA